MLLKVGEFDSPSVICCKLDGLSFALWDPCSISDTGFTNASDQGNVDR